MAHIQLRSGPRAGERLEIVGDLTVGRETADIVIADEELSRRHALLRANGGALVIKDLGSLNGTWVDGRRIDGPTVLSHGMEFKVGGTVGRVELGEPQATRLSASRPDVAGDRSDVTVVGRVAGAGATLTDAPTLPDPQTPMAPGRAASAAAARVSAVAATPPAPPPPLAGAHAAPPALRAAAAQPQFGTVLRAGRRRRGIATRSIPAAAFVSAVVAVDAVALLVYFSGR